MTSDDCRRPFTTDDLAAAREGLAGSDAALLAEAARAVGIATPAAEAARAAGQVVAAGGPAPYELRQRDSVWGFAPTAARLADLLARAAGEKDRVAAVLEHADYLATFHNEPDERARSLAAAALLLAGAAVEPQRDAVHWRRIAQARLASSLEAEKVDDAAAAVARAAIRLTAQRGQPLMSALRAWADAKCPEALPATPELHCAVTMDEFLSALDLDHPGLEEVKGAVARGDRAAAAAAYARHRISFLRGLMDYLGDAKPSADLDEAKEALDNIFILRAHMHRRHDYGKEVDWTTVLDGDIESNVAINHHAQVALLAAAYAQTGEARYAEHALRLLRSWLDQAPCPDTWKYQLQWRTLEVGGRMINNWPIIQLRLLDFPGLAEALPEIARSSLEQARYLEAHPRTRDNWFQVETSGLAAVAVLYPEFKESDRFFRGAMRRYHWVNGESFFPDGFQTENSVYYHAFPLGCIGNLCRLAEACGRPAPAELLRIYEKGLEVFVHTAQPDLSMPMVNDIGPNVSYVSGPLKIGLRLFPRPDFEHLASQRASGLPPAELSHAFRQAGYYVMRDGWGANDQYVLFDAGFYGSGHQHEDKLNFIFWAGGRCLLGDPGIYRYSFDEFEDYFRSSRGHNVIQIDGKGQARCLLCDRAAHKVNEPVPDPDTIWLPGDKCDYAAGWYKDGFATRLHALWSADGREDERATLDKTLLHKRVLFYVRGEYLVLRDLLLGAGEHDVEQYFHLAPIVEAHTAEGVRPGRAAIGEDLVVRTEEPELANVALIPAQVSGRSVRFVCGDRHPVAGFTCLYGERPAMDVIYRQRARLPLALDTVVLPLAKGADAIPRLDAVPLDEGAGAALRLTWEDRTDLVLLSDEGPGDLRAGDLAARGQAAWVRLDAHGKCLGAAGTRLERLSYRGKELTGPAS